MRILLDTHVFLWYIAGDPRTPPAWVAAISDPGNQVYLSAASVWEASIKYRLGKLRLPEPASLYLPRGRSRHGFETLPIEEADTAVLETLPDHHRDPFDRMIVSQAIRHRLFLATVDPELQKYPVDLLP